MSNSLPALSGQVVGWLCGTNGAGGTGGGCSRASGELVLLGCVLTDHARHRGRDRPQETGPIRGRGVARSSRPALSQPEQLPGLAARICETGPREVRPRRTGRMTDVFVGIDVSKDQLDVAARPDGESWRVANTELGIASLV